MADIGQLRLVVDAETKGMERAMMRVQQNLKATETAMQALGKGEAANATKAATLERAMVSLARKGLDGNHEAMKRLVGAHNQIQKEMEESAKAAKLAEQRQKDYNAAIRSSQNIAAGVAAGIALTAAATVKAVSVYGQFEQAQIAFETMLGSAERGQAFLEDMWQFAKATPFSYEGVQESAKQLLAYGFTAEKIPDILWSIGDAAAGLGGGAQTIDRISRALGQMQAKQKVSAEEMRQLTEAGIPAWQILADAIGTTIPNAMKLAEQGAIPASRAIDGLISGIGKRYEGLMDQQSRSLVGLMSTTKDLAFGQRGLFGRFGEYAADAVNLHERIAGLNGGLEKAIGYVEKGGFGALWEEVAPDWLDGKIYIIAGAVAGALTPAMIALGTATWGAVAPLLPFIAMGAAVGGTIYGIAHAADVAVIAIDRLRQQWLIANSAMSSGAGAGGGFSAGSGAGAGGGGGRAGGDDLQTSYNPAWSKQAIDAAAAGALETPMFGQSYKDLELSLRALTDNIAKQNNEWLKSMGAPGFATGGYTTGGTKQVAGVVHGGEYVMPAWMVDKYPELAAAAEGIRTRGYADGGSVGGNIDAGNIANAGKAMARLTGIMKSASKEGARGGDIFATDKARQAAGIYQLTGRSITDALNRAYGTGRDSMYNLSAVVANNSRAAKDSAVQNFGNIAAAADQLADQEPRVIQIIRLSDEELQAAKVDWPKTFEEIAAGTLPKLQALADAMKITSATAGNDMATGIQTGADGVRVALGTLTIDAEGQMALFNLALTGVMTAAVSQMGQQGAELDALMSQVLNNMANQATFTAAIWVLKNQDMEDALDRLKIKLASMKEPADNLHWSIRDSAAGSLEALTFLADEGDMAIARAKGAFVDFAQSVVEGTPAWAEFGNALIDVAEMAIDNAEAQLIAAKAVAIAEAVLNVFKTGGASLLAIPGILLQAAAGMALLEGARALIPDPIETPKAAAGGIVPARVGGTNVIVGEGGQPEAIIPLDRLDQYLQSAQPISGGRGNGSGITLQVVINNPVVRDDRDIDRLAEEVMEAAVRRLKREGVVMSG